MEFNWTEIVLAGIAILGSIVTHVLDKRKFNGELAKLKAETDSDNIQNMDKSLDFYEKLADATNKRLDDVLARQQIILNENTQLKKQVADVDAKMAQLTSIICTKLTCKYREVDESVVNCIYPTKSKKRLGKTKVKS